MGIEMKAPGQQRREDIDAVVNFVVKGVLCCVVVGVPLLILNLLGHHG